MRRLNVDYIDVIQCHDIEFVDVSQIIRETLPGAARPSRPMVSPHLRCFSLQHPCAPAALQALKRAGRVGAVGITGLPLPVFRRVLDAAPPGLVDVVRPRATVTAYAHSSQPAGMLMGAARMPHRCCRMDT